MKKYIAGLLAAIMMISVWPEIARASEQDLTDQQKTSTATDSVITESIGNLDPNESLDFSAGALEHKEPVLVQEELVHRRTANTKEFRMSDGSISLQQYEQAVHYKEGEGENAIWKNIDNTLTYIAATHEYRTENGEIGFAFAKDSKEKDMVTAKNGDYALSFGLAGIKGGIMENTATGQTKLLPLETQKAKRSVSDLISETKSQKAEKEEAFLEEIQGKTVNQAALLSDTVNQVVYKDAFESTDIEYQLEGNRLRENIMVHCPSADYGYTFNITAEGLSAEKTEQGGIDFKAGNTVIFSIPAPCMYDRKGVYSEAVTFEIAGEQGQYTLTLKPDAAWMNADDREYPVTIDPDLVIRQEGDGDGNVISTGCYTSWTKKLTQNPALLYLGYSATDGYYRSFAKINELPSLPDGAVMVNAYLSLAMYTMEQAGGRTSARISARQATGSSWHMQYDSPIQDFYTITSSSLEKYQHFDITSAAFDWYNGKTNNGIVFVTEDTMSATSYAKVTAGGIYKEDQNLSAPVFQLNYRNTLGIEDYYTYHTADAGNAGQLYIGDYNRQVTAVKPIASGGIYTFSYIYNSALSYWDYSSTTAAGIHTVDYSNMLAGRGWKTSAQESIVSQTVSGTSYLVHADADGTEHYYKANGSVYESEDGLGTKITQSGTVYTMTDDQDNKKIFRRGYLSEIIDNQGNKVAFLYNTTTYSATGTGWHPTTGSNQLRRIVEINNGQSAYTIASFTYTGNYISKITDRYGNVTTITLAALENKSRNIIDIRDGFNHIAYYGYGGGNYKMSYAYDYESRYGIRFEYKGVTVSSYYEYYSPEFNGTRTVRTKYGVNGAKNHHTLFRYAGADTTFNTSDDLLTNYVFDNFGRTITTYSTDNSGKTIYGAAAAAYVANSGTSKQNNRVLKEAVKGGSSENYLYDAGFESQNADLYTNFSNAATFSTTKVHTGVYSARIAGTSTSISPRFKQGAYLSAGKYTFSGYVNVASLSSLSDAAKAGARLYIRNASDTEVFTTQSIKAATNQSADGGWVRLTLPFEITTAGTYYFFAELHQSIGTVYFDDLQVEPGDVSSANLVTDGRFEKPLVYWDAQYGSVSAVKNASIGDSTYLRMTGSQTGLARAKQVVKVNKSAESTYILSGWAYAEQSVAKREGVSSTFEVRALVNYSNGTSDPTWTRGEFNRYASGQWQYISVPIVPNRNKGKVVSIDIVLSYDYNANNVYFDNISLTMDPASAYTYNTDGKVVSVLESEKSEVSATYSAGNLKTMTSQAVGTVTHTYDSKHNVTSSTNGGITMNYTYDSMGNVTSTKLSGTGTMFMKGTASYTSYGEKLSKEVNTAGAETRYTYDSQGRVEDVTVPGGWQGSEETTTSRRYNEKGLLSMLYIAGEIAVENSYQNGRLSEVKRGSYKTGDSTNRILQSYTMGYDVFGNKTSVKVGNKTLATYQYSDYAQLKSVTYGNGEVISYQYDEHKRVSEIQHGPTKMYVLGYDAAGNLNKIENRFVKLTYYYDYDSIGRVKSIYTYDSDTGSVKTSLSFTYDTENRVTGYTYNDGSGTAKTVKNTYNSNGTQKSFTNGWGDQTNTFVYDSLQRLTKKTTAHSSESTWTYSKTYQYWDGASGVSGQTTGQIAALGYEYNNANTTNKKNQSFLYEYDAAGQITKVSAKEGSTTRILAKYQYDSRGQMVLEQNYASGKSYVYDYDGAGNIERRRTYGSTGYPSVGDVIGDGKLLATDEYTYGNSQWVDLLTAYQGKAITYDAIGNPKTYYDGTTFTWNPDRSLNGIKKNGKSTDYYYDYNGNRVSKWNGIWRNYDWVGDKLMREEWDDGDYTYQLSYVYDENGVPEGVKYSQGNTTTRYYYITNAQGDIVALRKADNTLVGTYEYDAYGKILAVKDANGNIVTSAKNIMNINPLRYRGYYYDAETGFYCLQSRYYDPEIGRFINADIFLSTGQDLAGYNMFAYCGNNPVSRVDPTGKCYVLNGCVEWQPCAFMKNYSGPYNKMLCAEEEARREEERLAVAWTIIGEAGSVKNHPDSWQKGQEAVAWTIINRHNKTGDTWIDIVTAPLQFLGYYGGKEWYEDGRVYTEEYAIAWDYAYTLGGYVVYDYHDAIPYPEGFTENHTSFRQETGQDHAGKFGRRGMVTYGGNTFFY
ncbi:MAG: hypothetical protein HFE77_00010 [Clostridiales bacterium]|nr:hypothetical protein [Clostridiales bacterium]